MRKRLASVVSAVVIAAAAESAAQTGPSHASVPVVHAVRATPPSSSTAAWTTRCGCGRRRPPTFTQRDPDEGKPATEATELRIAYDDDALYVGGADARPRARRGSRGSWPAAIRTPRPTASRSCRSPSRSSDRRVVRASARPACRATPRSTTIRRTDNSWDAVWESAVKIDEAGWSAGDADPVFAAAVLPRPTQLTFGINAMRYIQRKKEQAWLVHVPKTESGMASRMGHLEGLNGVSPHRTVELLPYLVEPRASSSSARHRRRSVQRRRAAFAGAGLDLKYRVSSSLSLDGTINPDFGQVEVDPAVVNLTAFETFFEEKRPFFIEGANIFSNFGRDRRQQLLGLQPRRADASSIRGESADRRRGTPSGDFVDAPTADHDSRRREADRKDAQRLEPRPARCGDRARAGEDRHQRLRAQRTEVEPLSNYFVGRVAARDRRRAAVGVLATAVNRDLRQPALASRSAGAGVRRRRRRALLSRRASATG